MNGRRNFLRQLATLTGAAVAVPAWVGCSTTPQSTASPQSSASTASSGAQSSGAESSAALTPIDPPTSKPAGWEPISFNRDRGLAGAVPEDFRAAITGEDGEAQIGKHLPYVPAVDAIAGKLALMFGDPSAGYPQHPNNGEGDGAPAHMYDWIRVRKATDDDASELTSSFSDWPTLLPSDSGAYPNGQAPTDNGGRDTVYLAALPSDVVSGDVVRVVAHCTLHGEYIDFVTVP